MRSKLLVATTKYESTVLGTGIVPVKEVIDYGPQDWHDPFLIMNRNRTRAKHALDSVKEDLAIMKKWGY